jgi:hypothetical protein
MSKLKALKDYHGMPTLFVTILPDDTHDKKKCLFNRLIMTISLQFLGTLLMHYKITIPRIMVFQYSVIIFENYLLADLLQLLSAEMFKIIIEIFFSLVLASPAHQFVKKNNSITRQTCRNFWNTSCLNWIRRRTRKRISSRTRGCMGRVSTRLATSSWGGFQN